MRIDPFVRDLPQYQNDLVGVLEDPRARLYLDTSTLMWLVRLSKSARSEFIDWCGTKRTLVPVWAAHEFQRHLLEGTVRVNMNKVVAETASKQRLFAEIAAEQADDAVCLARGFGQRSTYIAEIQRLMAGFHRLGRVLEIDDERLRTAADDVIAFINERSLSTELDSIIAELSNTGDFRLGHRVPPGHKDAYKEENKLGDAVIWREILQDIERASRPATENRGRNKVRKRRDPVAGVLVSRDEKTDWVSTSFVRLTGGQVTKADRDLEQDVTLPHPLLGHEFARAGGGTFFLVHPAALSGVAQSMQKKSGQPSTVGHWRAASVRPDVLEKMLARATQEERRLEASKGGSARDSAGDELLRQRSPVVPTAAAAPVELTGLTARDVMKGSIATEVREYLDAKTNGREAVLARWTDAVKKGAMNAAKLGRVICRLCAEEDGLDVADVPALLEALPRELSGFADLLVLGALCAAHFDDSGHALQRPWSALANALLLLEESVASKEAFVVLQRLLRDAGVSLPYVPGSQVKVKVACTASPATTTVQASLQDLRIDGHAVLVDGLTDFHPRRLSALLGSDAAPQCKASTLLGLLSREYMIPPGRIDASGLSESKILSWRPDLGLLPIDTNAPGGIGELNDEDSE